MRAVAKRPDKQCPFVRFTRVSVETNDWRSRNCKHEIGHEEPHEDHYGTTEGLWAAHVVWQERPPNGPSDLY